MMAKISTPDRRTDLIVREHADDFVRTAMMRYGFAEGIRVGKKRFANGRARGRPRGWRAPGRPDEAAALDAEERYGVDVFRLGARTMTRSTLKCPLVMRLESPKKNARVPMVVKACTSGAASRM